LGYVRQREKEKSKAILQTGVLCLGICGCNAMLPRRRQSGDEELGEARVGFAEGHAAAVDLMRWSARGNQNCFPFSKQQRLQNHKPTDPAIQRGPQLPP